MECIDSQLAEAADGAPVTLIAASYRPEYADAAPRRRGRSSVKKS